MFLVVICALFFFSLSIGASPVDTYVFKDPQTKQQFQLLTKELRCPKCQNQNLADSNSPIAADLRKIVYDMLQDGKTSEQIVDFMVYRYGDFVLYKPKVNKMTYVLWFGPVALFLLVLTGIFISVRRRSGNKAVEEVALSATEQAKLDDLIN
ncbi:cytochrome c-type biogenesis protein CcmH [Thalassotalea sp. 42_200_T64]|nr:cytochrome c-type biogenesis protein CcmH [Thalassotalea sp. 42_200_T64]